MSFVTKTAASLFLLIALLHLLRVIQNWPAQIVNWQVPIWLSVVIVIITILLSYGLFKQN